MAIRRATLNNPRLLAWARETAHLTVEELAGRMGQPPETIRAWEAGDAAPTFAQLDRLAKHVERSVAILYLPSPPDEPQPPRDFRRLPGSRVRPFTPEMALAFREMRNALSDAREILSLLGDDVVLDLPQMGLTSDPSETGQQLRTDLGVPVAAQLKWANERAALDEWRSVLYDRGVLVQQFSLSVDEMRGFSLLGSDLGGIGVSSKDVPAARIFSLAHEVGHLCLRQPGVSPDAAAIPKTSSVGEALVERYCEAFAASFLLPDADSDVRGALTEVASQLTLERAQWCASQFKVSKYAVLNKLVDMDLLSRASYRDTDRAWRERDSHVSPRRPGWVPPVRRSIGRQGKRFAATVIEALDTSAISRYEAARALGLSPKYLAEVRTVVFH